MKRTHDGADGFTLIETAIALTVLLAGILAGGHLFTYAVATEHRAAMKSEGALLVAGKAEELQARGRGSAVGGSLDRWNPAPGFHEYLELASNGGWQAAAGPGAGAALRLWRVLPTRPLRGEVAVYDLTSHATPPLAYATVPLW